MVMPLPVSIDPARPIPKFLHLVWVGSEVPDWVNERWEAWRDNCPNWTVNYWTDKSFAWWPRSAKLASLCPHPAILADLIRIEVVSTLGGVYVDSDTWPLRSMNDLAGERRPWCSSTHQPPQARLELNNAAFGFPAGHVYLATVWDECLRRLQSETYDRLSYYTGPPVWTQQLNRTPQGIEVLPVNAFNPADWQDRWVKLPALVEDLDRAREAFPDSYAVHEYESSWNYHTLPIRSGR